MPSLRALATGAALLAAGALQASPLAVLPGGAAGRPTATRFAALHHAASSWEARIPELAALEDPLARRKALRSWVEYLHRSQATLMDDDALAAAMPHLSPGARVALVLLNLHRLRDDPAAQQALAPWVDPAGIPALEASLRDFGLVPASLGWIPDLDDLEEEFGFGREELKPLALSALRGFLEGRFTPRQLEYYMGMQNSRHGQLGRAIAARVWRVDPMLRGLEATCGFRAAPVHAQAKIVFFKYLVGDVRTDTFRSWFRMAGDPALTACLVGQLDPSP